MTTDAQRSELYKATIGRKGLDYYLKRFTSFDERGGRFYLSWNWAAFFLTWIWALYRKMYAVFFIVLGISIILRFTTIGPSFPRASLIVALFFGFGLYGNALYYQHRKKEIAKAQTTPPDNEALLSYLRSKGGVHGWVIGLCPVLLIVIAFPPPGDNGINITDFGRTGWVTFAVFAVAAAIVLLWRVYAYERKQRTVVTPVEEETPQTVRPIPFEFTGRTDEYFKIWVVNIFLTLLTLGAYSAWAKVRRKRYFYGNTMLENMPFEYLAQPIQILTGRSIVVALVVFLVFAGLLEWPEALLALLFLLALPWLVVEARTFNTTNSSYRNIRFSFRTTYGEAFKVFFELLLLAGLTLGLAYPYFAYRRSQFIVRHTYYGTARLTLSDKVTIKHFYQIYAAATLILVIAGIFVWQMLNLVLPPDLLAKFTRVVTLGLFVCLYLGWFAYVRARTINLVWSNTVVGNSRFESKLDPYRMIWLYLTNAGAILISLGLLIPWASIRMARYRLDNLKLLTATDLDNFVVSEQEKVSATGEEISEFFDVDVGI